MGMAFSQPFVEMPHSFRFVDFLFVTMRIFSRRGFLFPRSLIFNDFFPLGSGNIMPHLLILTKYFRDLFLYFQRIIMFEYEWLVFTWVGMCADKIIQFLDYYFLYIYTNSIQSQVFKENFIANFSFFSPFLIFLLGENKNLRKNILKTNMLIKLSNVLSSCCNDRQHTLILQICFF